MPSSTSRVLWWWSYALLVMLLGCGWLLAFQRPLVRDELQHGQPTGKKIAINHASATELSLLPGIGPGLARRIVQDRKAQGLYSQVQDLLRVPGVGPTTLRRITPYILVDPTKGQMQPAD